MKTISVVNQKGGCGKTVTAVNLAAGLSKAGHKVLLIDIDPQAHASFALRQQKIPTITDVLELACQGKPFPAEDAISCVQDNFYFISSSLGLASLENSLAARSDKLDILKNFLGGIAGSYDYCFLDCPPNLGLITLNALSASDYSLIPLNTCSFSLQGLQLLKNIMLMLKEYKGAAPAPFYVLNQVDTRSNYARDFVQMARRRFGPMLLRSSVRLNTSLREAVAAGKHIFDYAPLSRGALDFSQLADEVESLTMRTGWTPLFLKNHDISEAYVVGDFNNWQKSDNYRLVKTGDDIWSINLPLAKGEYRYKFLSGDNWFADPLCVLQEADPFGGKHSVLKIE